MNLRTLGAVAVVLAGGTACAQLASSTSADGGAAHDATADAAPPVCGITPLIDLDREGLATADGVTSWVDFSRASDAPLVPPIAACGREVRLPVMLHWTSPRAGFLRVRVQRDRPEPRSPGTLQPLTVRRVATCAWDATALGYGLTGFDRDPALVGEDFEFPVEAGPQWIVLAWTFGYVDGQFERVVVPALRVAFALAETSRIGQACTPRAAIGDANCPLGSDCDAVDSDVPRCVAQGSAGAFCRGAAPRCDGDLVCGASPPRCVRPAAAGEPCDATGCAAGYACRWQGGAPPSVCVPAGQADASCRAPSDARGACDAGLACNLRRGGRCMPPVVAGGPCDGDPDCLVGEVCSGRRCVPTGSEWTPCERPSGNGCLVGLSCFHGLCVRRVGLGGDCLRALCEFPFTCLNDRCIEPSTEHCRELPDSCPAGLVCFGRCVPAGGLGEAPVGGRCLNGLRADGGRCLVYGVGSNCEGDDECLRGTVCRDGWCVVEGQCPPPLLPRSAPRVLAHVCDTASRCVATSDGAAVCRPLGRDGGLCRTGVATACDDGLRCVGGVCVVAPSKSTGVCAANLACPPGARCDLGCTTVAPIGRAGGRCRRAADGSGVCDRALRCDPLSLTCVP